MSIYSAKHGAKQFHIEWTREDLSCVRWDDGIAGLKSPQF